LLGCNSQMLQLAWIAWVKAARGIAAAPTVAVVIPWIGNGVDVDVNCCDGFVRSCFAWFARVAWGCMGVKAALRLAAARTVALVACV
jgi:hypothetical protein